MKPCIIIPARYASTRYPGKPLVNLKGKDGDKTLIERVWLRALDVLPAADVYVATDDARIRDHAQNFGAQTVMTSEQCRNGTERCAEVARGLSQYDIFVNLQGDAPLTPADFLEALIGAMEDAEVATPVLRMDEESYLRFIEDRKAGRVGGTTAVFDQKRNALYFSKEVIPYLPSPEHLQQSPVFHHVGAYAYRLAALERYMAMPPTPYEQSEGLEQLRFLESGVPVRCVEVDGRGRVFWELNNPEDVARIERELK